MKKKIPAYCAQCYNGPDLFTVVVEDDLIRSLEPNFQCSAISPAGGRICVKAYGLIQKMYNPDRIKTPLLRTNPRKGKDEDPAWKEISWEEAYSILAEKMKKVRQAGIVDTEGFPKLAVIMGQAGSPAAYMGTLAAFFAAWGAVDFSVGGGEGVKCYHSEHLYGEYWHRSFIAAADTPRCELVVSFGHNTNASGGAAGVLRHAEARNGRYKRIQIEPHLSASASTADQWIAIKPKTDAAFMYALIHVLIHEMERTIACDLVFLKKRTNSPYLVGPHGYFIRDEKTESPLVWDSKSQRAVRFDDPGISEFALEGSYQISGVEVGADGEKWRHQGIPARTAFQELVDFIKAYTPEWAAAVCDVEAGTIRDLAHEIIKHAHIGEQTSICGEKLPWRPVAFLLGKTINNGPGGYQATWARTVLAMLIGALEVPGGTMGASQRINKPHNDRWSSVWPGSDGFMRNNLNSTDRENWSAAQKSRARFESLVPLVSNNGWSQFLSPYPLAWLTMDQGWGDYPRTTFPEIVLLYRTNPGISMYQTELINQQMSRFPFFVCVGYTLDETNHFADLILPDHTDLEGLQLVRVGPSVHSESFWNGYGFALRHAAVPPIVDSMDMTDFATELAGRVGILKEYNEAINAGVLLSFRLKDKQYNYELDADKKYTKEEIWDRLCKAATMALSEGKEEHGLQWFKQNGYYTVPYPLIRHFLHPVMVRWGLRYELPYQENIKRVGSELAARLHEHDTHWWDEQLDEYQALPVCEDFSKVYEELFNTPESDYNFWLVNTRSMQYAWGSNAAIPLMAEAAKNVPGFKGVLINSTVARQLGIKENQMVTIASRFAQVKARAVPRQGVRPDTLVFSGQFGHWKTPFARKLKIPNLNPLVRIDPRALDAGGSMADVLKVKILKEG